MDQIDLQEVEQFVEWPVIQVGNISAAGFNSVDLMHFVPIESTDGLCRLISLS